MPAMTADARRPGEDRGPMARHPLLTFVLVGMAPALVLSGNILASTISLAALFPALAAALIVSDGDAAEPVPGDRARRLLLAAGVCVVLAEARLARSGFGALSYVALVSVVPVALAAWILSGAYSPSPGLRALVRPLVSVRATRPAYLVALLAWPVAAVAAAALCSRLPGVSVSPPGASSAGLLAGWLISGAVGSALVAVAWYGFVAQRLLSRLSPLGTGLLVGVAQWLLIWGVTLRPGNLLDAFYLSGLAGAAATGVAGVWVFTRARGSLLPIWIMQALLVAAGALAFLVVVPDLAARTDAFNVAFAATRVAVALALVTAGRMWRRTRTPAAP